MTIDEMIAVLQAAKAGKPIELRCAMEPDDWRQCSLPRFDFSRFDYRVKREPREGYVQPNWLKVEPPYPESIRVREVL